MAPWVKTTIYLPEELKQALERTTAAIEGRSEAEVIREALTLRTNAEPSARVRAGRCSTAVMAPSPNVWMSCSPGSASIEPAGL